MLKKWFVMCMVLVCAMLSFSASALALEGSGTEASPYLVGTLSELNTALGKGGYIQLTNDVELTSKLTFYTDKSDFFVLDGQNHQLIRAASYTKYDHLIHIRPQTLTNNQSSVTIKNLTIDCVKKGKSVNIYGVGNITLDNVTIQNATSAFSSLTVNGSVVNAIDLKIINGSMDAIDVDRGSDLFLEPSISISGESEIYGNIKTKKAVNAKVYLTSGVYSKEPAKEYIVEGYEAVRNAEGLYEIVPITYNVKFEMGGAAAMKDQTVGYGKGAVLPENMKRAGYVFGGWYLDKDFTKPYNGEVLESDITLYALWTKIPSLPSTGDRSALGMWTMMAALSACAWVVLRKCDA